MSKLESELVNMRQLQAQLTEYENRITLLTTEIERLNTILHQRLSDIEEWKSRFNRIEIELNKYRVFEDKCRDYESRIQLLL